MSEVFSLELRPKTFPELIGQRVLTDAIIKHYSSGRESRAWMFVGDSGTGKTTLARILAVSLNCTHQKIFGSPCSECYENRYEFQITEVNASEASTKEQAEQIAYGSNYTPLPPSKRRVYILDEAQKLSDGAQNLLLKFFEDSPKTTVWIVCTTEPGKIIKTLRGRCLVYPLEPLGPKGTAKLIDLAKKAAKTEFDTQQLYDELIRQKVNSPRNILMALEKVIAGMPVEKAVFGGEAAINTLRICQAVVKGSWEGVKDEMQKASLEDARITRLALASYLRTVMLTAMGERSRQAAAGIELLAQASRTEEGLQLAYTVAVLYKIARVFAGGTTK